MEHRASITKINTAAITFSSRSGPFPADVIRYISAVQENIAAKRNAKMVLGQVSRTRHSYRSTRALSRAIGDYTTAHNNIARIATNSSAVAMGRLVMTIENLRAFTNKKTRTLFSMNYSMIGIRCRRNRNILNRCTIL